MAKLPEYFYFKIRTTLDGIELVDASNIDVAEIVRCHECRFAHLTCNGEVKRCDNWDDEDGLYPPGDFYCAYGERRDEEQPPELTEK